MFFAQQTEQTLAFNVNRPPHLSCNKITSIFCLANYVEIYKSALQSL